MGEDTPVNIIEWDGIGDTEFKMNWAPAGDPIFNDFTWTFILGENP